MRDKPLDTTKHKLWYKPLDKTKNEIRVLKFLGRSSPVSAKDTIQCSIRNVSLGIPRHSQWHRDSDQKFPIAWDRFTTSVELRDSTLEQTTDDKIAYARLLQSSPQCSGSRYDWGDFAALSYTWGNASDIKTIYVNGVRKNVPRNLEEALRALRNLEETLFGMCYWIDSLCIDQENIEERNEQVKRMNEIYGRARAVIVWLGQEEEMDKIAVQIMHRLCARTTLKRPVDMHLHEWSAIFAFAQKPYWSRCWIIQELAMNHNSTLFLCGDFKLTRNLIESGAFWGVTTSYNSEEIDHQSRHNLQPRAWAILHRVHTLVRMMPREYGVLRADALLNLVRGAEATDKRDKIYSILGLLDPAIFAGVTPDYSLSVQQVYTDFMKSTINGSGRLDQIAFGGMPVEKDWPSWVPDWRKSFERHQGYDMLAQGASRAISAKVRFIQKGKDRTYLECSGCQVDTVDGIAAEPPLDSHATQSSSVSDIYNGQTLKAIKQTFGMSHSDWPGEALFEVPWNFSPDTYDNMLSSPERLELFQSRPLERWEKFRKHNKDFCIGGQKFRSFFAQNDEQRLDIAFTLQCLHSALRSLDHRALITTRTGYLGLAPVATHPGDVLAILFGCRWPVVLRPCDSGLYQLIGECYIHGLMDGEFFDQQQDEHVSEQEFILC